MVDVAGAVVDSLAAPGVVVDSAGVVEHVGSIDGGGCGVNVDQLLQLVLIRAPVVVVAGDGGLVVVAGVVIVAGHVGGVVRSAALLLHVSVVSLHDPVHVGDHEASVTASVAVAPAVSAVHEVLLGEVVLQVSGHLPHAGVDGCHGGEDGAAAAGSLVVE